MPQTGDRESSVSLFSAVWRPQGALYLVFCLAGLAAGLWPGAIFLPRTAHAGAPLPALQALAVAQIAFGLLVQPLVALRRARGGAVRRYWPGAVASRAAYLFLTLPFYIAAAYLADAVAADAVRAAIYVACVWTLPLVAGSHLAAGRAGRSVVMLVLVVAALGLPAAHYIALEFVTPRCAAFFARLSPFTFAWIVSGPRGGCWYPQPLWALLVWPAVAAAGLCLATLICPARPVGEGASPAAESPDQ